ncbi:MAG: cyclodeaminase/cyclohydrolase family protein [Elusimicrobiota bacterium]|nr:cyclodeaminase/cyclohydrolase family protein [Elusimicrobiota bacterium]
MEKKYLNSSLKEYLNDLSAKLPAPGGGSAAAVVSATGVSCLLMVANFTLNKKGYEKYNDVIKEIIAILSESQKSVCELIDEDVTAYTVLAVAYKLPKNTDDEIKERKEKIQEALKNSLSVPCKIFEISVAVLTSAERLTEIGNKNLLSDVACGVSILRAGIESAKFNIDINLKFMDDADFKEETKIKYEKTMKGAFEEIEKIIKKTESGVKL